ncbi:MAG: ABC transporter ATP-binding protein [Treponema sp.]|jgi:peptide/nickel transport system ATP-binding protein|nr:ABC transporter ATP-binding protein [Treponema sp.]
MRPKSRETPLLRVENLSIAISRGKKTFTAVDGIGFSLREGEILGIVGESGCGKSLTALSIPGLLPSAARVSSGSISFDGRDLRSLSEQEYCLLRGKEIAMVFQEPALSLNPLMRIGRQIEEMLELHGSKDKKINRNRIVEIMENLGLREGEELIRSYPHQLSGGMCQRVMIALAMIGNPRLLIADEPTTALDLTTQAQILDLMRELNHKRGNAILFISHDLGVIRRLCRRVLVMYAGKIVESGTVEDVFDNPLHEYTKSLIDSIPCRERKGLPLANIPGRVPSVEERLPGCPFAPRCGKAREDCCAAFPAERVFNGKQDECAAHQVYCIQRYGETENNASEERGRGGL